MIQIDFVFISEVVYINIDEEVFGIEGEIADGVIIERGLVVLGIVYSTSVITQFLVPAFILFDAAEGTLAAWTFGEGDHEKVM